MWQSKLYLHRLQLRLQLHLFYMYLNCSLLKIEISRSAKDGLFINLKIAVTLHYEHNYSISQKYGLPAMRNGC